MIRHCLVFLAGVALLYGGGHWLVDGASSLARKFRWKPFVIGVIIVGFGTSMPEAFVSVLAQFKGASDLALGNIVGSNIANIGLILGLAAVIQPIAFQAVISRQEFLFLLFVTIVFCGLAAAGPLTAGKGIAFLLLFGAFLLWSLRHAGEVGAADVKPDAKGTASLCAMVLGGIGGLVLASELIVRSGAAMARHFGVSELVIGTTMVAVGTSLPELAACVISALKREGDLALGNIIGSNVFNLLFVTGAALMIAPIGISVATKQLLLPSLVIMTLVLFPMLLKGPPVGRWEGAALLAAYAFFLFFLFAFRAQA